MRLPTVASAALVLYVAAALACSEPPTQTGSPPVGVQSPTRPPTLYPTIELTARARTMLVGDVDLVRGVVAMPGSPGQTDPTLWWKTSDSTVATLEPLEEWVGRVHARSPGTTVITAYLPAYEKMSTASFPVTVLAASSAPSPIVIEDFYVEEHADPDTPGQWRYAPQLVLRDSTAATGRAVVKLSFDIAGVGASLDCWTDVALGGAPIAVGRGPVGEYRLTLARPGARAAPGAEAVARITVRLTDAIGVRLSARGAVIPNYPAAVDVGSADPTPFCR